MEKETITLEQDGYEIELPKLEAHILIKKFVGEVEQNIIENGEPNREKCNQLSNIIQDTDLLTQEEETELLTHNHSEGGKTEKAKEDIEILWETATDFIKDL